MRNAKVDLSEKLTNIDELIKSNAVEMATRTRTALSSYDIA